MGVIRVRPMATSDLPWAEATVIHHFGTPDIVSRGRLHHLRDLCGWIAEDAARPVGLLLIREDDGSVELVVLVSERKRQGIGTRLVETLRRWAEANGHRKLWLVTANDNLDAIAFYRAGGWRQVAIHKGAIEESRRLKPEIPAVGPSGLPIEDEIEFAADLDRLAD